MRLQHHSLFLLSALMVLPACLGTEGGNPVQPTIDSRKFSLVSTGPGEIEARGEPGTVTPPTANLRYVDLEGTGGFLTEEIAGDGSFLFRFTADASHRFRFRAIEGDGRSLPLNRIPQAFGGPVPGFPTCIVAPDDVTFQAGGMEVVAVRNDCTDSLSISSARLLFADGSFSILADSPTTLTSGMSFTVTVTRDGSGPAENILVFESDRGPVPVTLIER